MPEVEYSTALSLPRETIWEFVKDINNWAPFLTGYQKHEIESETDSVWTLKGDVGVLRRRARPKAHGAQWNGPGRGPSTPAGLDEVVEGGATFSIARPNGAAAADGS